MVHGSDRWYVMLQSSTKLLLGYRRHQLFPGYIRRLTHGSAGWDLA